jgi:uncharacterized protein
MTSARRGRNFVPNSAIGGIDVFSLGEKAWSPYLAGILIGLLQIPAFLIIETALGASSSYVTVGALIASWIDPSILRIDYVAKHVAATAKNWWQVAFVGSIAVGALLSARLSGAARQNISPSGHERSGRPRPAGAISSHSSPGS